MNKTLPRVALVLALFLVVGQIQKPIDEQRVSRKTARKNKLLYLPKSQVMKLLSFGHSGVMGHMLFLQSLKYLLVELKQNPNPLYINRLFNTLVAIDPQGIHYYTVGSLFLSSLAQREQAGLDLLARADQRHYQVNFDEVLPIKAPEGEPRPVKWLDFATWVTPQQPQGGLLHPQHPKRHLIPMERASYFIIMKRDYQNAGHEFIVAGEMDSNPDRDLVSHGKFLIERSKQLTPVARLEIAKLRLQEQIKGLGNEALKKEASQRLDEIRVRLNEIYLEGFCKYVQAQDRQGPVRSVEDLMGRFKALLKSADPRLLKLGFAQLDQFLRSKPKAQAKILASISPDQPDQGSLYDPYETGYLLLSDGRVRSPGRVIHETRRRCLERLRDYQERHQRRYPETLKEAGIKPENLPPEARVKYDAKSGQLSVEFRPS